MDRRMFLGAAAVLATLPVPGKGADPSDAEAAGALEFGTSFPDDEFQVAVDDGYGSVVTGHVSGDFVEVEDGTVSTFPDHHGVWIGVALDLAEAYDSAGVSAASRLTPTAAREVATVLLVAADRAEAHGGEVEADQ